jgi:hypothetical protein
VKILFKVSAAPVAVRGSADRRPPPAQDVRDNRITWRAMSSPQIIVGTPSAAGQR